MNLAYNKSISRLKRLYVDFPDISHDWEHSKRVARISVAIARNIGYQDIDFIKLAALWHDSARTQGFEAEHEKEGAQLAKNDLLNHGLDNLTADKLYQAIRFHNISDKPEAIEGKIVQDADILDLFNISRWKKCRKSGWNNSYQTTFEDAYNLLENYPERFNFDYSKKIFNKIKTEFQHYFVRQNQNF